MEQLGVLTEPEVHMSEPVKYCASCCLLQPHSNFHRKSAAPDGLFPRCKTCRKAQDAKRYAATVTDEVRAAGAVKQRRRRQEMSDEQREREHERNREYMRQRYAEHTATLLAKQRRNYEREPDRYLGYAEAYRRKHPERKAEYDKRFRLKYPDAVSESWRRRRARLIGASIGPVDLTALPAGTCGICHDAIDEGFAWPHPLSKSLDHVVPLARGGSHAQDNLQWAHLACNLRKGARLPL